MVGTNRYYCNVIFYNKRKGKCGGNMKVSTFPLFLILNKKEAKG